jgi:molecular chaperone DnaJ
MARDFYDVLGVPRDADEQEIKRAYRKLAMECHPDRNDSPDAEERFRQVTEAYEILRDPEQRARYDRFGEAGLGRGGAGAGGFGGAFDLGDAFELFMREFGGMGGAFGEMFGGGRRRGTPRGPRRGSDVRVRLPIELAEAARGVEKTLKLKILDPCEHCGGSGAAPGTSAETCSTCGGAGEVRHVQRSMLGQLVSVRPCPDCGGEGVRIPKPCGECRGAGRMRHERTIKVDVPAGVSSDDVLKLSGRGNAGPRGGGRGDVLVAVEVEAHPRFERRGDDLLLDLPVTFSQAALGAEVDVPTIDGPATLSIPAGIQSGQAIRMRGRGMPRLRASGRGDQIVLVRVWTPTDLSREQRQALEGLVETESQPPAPDRKEPGFWERVKQAFTA